MMKDKNFGSSRFSIINKYDKNGDGVIDEDEINAIVDDYMHTIKNNSVLVDTNQAQKKIIIFSAVMIILLSLSNFATAYLAVRLAREVTVSSNGSLITADGDQTTLKTLSEVKTLKIENEPLDEFSDFRRWRHLIEAEGEGGEEMTPITCFSTDQVEDLYNNAQEGYGTSLVFKLPGTNQEAEATAHVGGLIKKRLSDDTEAASFDEAETTDFVYSFPESGWDFYYAPEACESQRRRLIKRNPGLDLGSSMNMNFVGRMSAAKCGCTLDNQPLPTPSSSPPQQRRGLAKPPSLTP